MCLNDKYIWARGMCQECAYNNPKDKNHHPVRIAPVSDKRKKQNAEYQKVRIEFLNNNQVCQAKLPICTHWATEIHHQSGRIGDLLTDTNKFVAICRSCHTYIELHPEQAKEMGLSKNRL